MKRRIGILGGMGPEATMFFLRLLMRSISERFHPAADQDYPDMTIMMESSTPDRTAGILDETIPTGKRINGDLSRLHDSGCDPIAIACITAHAFVEPCWFQMGVVDFRDCIVRRFADDMPGRLAILATDGAIRSGVFEPLATHTELIFPPPAFQERLMSSIYGPGGLKSYPVDIPSCTACFSEILDDLRRNGADRILAGCTEIETFLSTQDIAANPVLPMAAMCAEIIDRLLV